MDSMDTWCRRQHQHVPSHSCRWCHPSHYTTFAQHKVHSEPNGFNGAHYIDTDDDNCFGVGEKELKSLYYKIPAFKRHAIDNKSIVQHFYLDGGWGWIVCGAAFLAQVLTTGLQLAYGIFHIYALHHHNKQYIQHVVWIGALCIGTSKLTSAIISGMLSCLNVSYRLLAILGGLLLPLACLFTSFAMELQQTLLSYGLVMGIACGLVRESAGYVLGTYFKRRRLFVELIVQSGGGIGIAVFSVFYKEAIGNLGWRLGLQTIAGVLIIALFLGTVYRNASLYHPMRRAILHLKSQHRRVKGKHHQRHNIIDLTPFNSKTTRALMLASALSAFGIYTPLFYLALEGAREGLEESALVLLQTFVGLSAVVGCAGFGFILIRPTTQCLVSKQYLCQTAMLGISLSLLVLSTIRGYHSYVMFAWFYGLCLGGFLYSIKMLTLERVKAKHFSKIWGYMQGAEVIPITLGVPMAGYIGEQSSRSGYYFACVATVTGAVALFFLGQSTKHNTSLKTNTIPISEFKACDCVYCTECPYCYAKPVSKLSKSYSYAAPLNKVYYDCTCDNNRLKSSKSVPEGLSNNTFRDGWSKPGSRTSSIRSYGRQGIKDVQIIEQMTTSV